MSGFKAIVVLAAFFAHGELLGQYVKPNEVEVVHLDKKLSYNTVSCIYQDSFGFIWFGTFDGLNRYDGKKIVVYKNRVNDSTSLSNSYIHCITEDSNGDLWIGTESGLNQYVREKEAFRQYLFDPKDSLSIPSGSITDIHVLEDNKIWAIGSWAFSLDPISKKIEQFPLNYGLKSNHRVNSYNQIFSESNGTLWFLCFNEIYRLRADDDKVELVFDGSADSSNGSGWYFKDMIRGRDGKFWVSTSGKGIYELDPVRLKLSPLNTLRGIQAEAFEDVNLLVVKRDSKEHLWVSAENLGLFVFDKDQNLIERYVSDPDNDQSISFNSIWSILEDNSGRMWLGTWKAGVDVIDPFYRKFAHYEFQKGSNSLSNNAVKEFLEDEKGNLYIATDGGGLNYFDRKKNLFEIFDHNESSTSSISADAVLSLEMDDNDKIWIGTWNGGINIFDPVTKKFTTPKELSSGLKSGNTFDIYFDGNEKMYCTDWGEGIAVYNLQTSEWSSFTHDPADVMSLGNNYLFSIEGDAHNNVWAASSGGAHRLSYQEYGKPVFRNYTYQPDDTTSLSHSKVQTMFLDRDGRFWLGTQGGLSRYDQQNDRFERVVFKDKNVSHNILSIVEDNSGCLWLGTADGLVFYNPESQKHRVYYQHDRIQGNQYSRNSAIKLTSGEIAIGGTNGFNLFHPDKVVDNPYEPPVFITEMKVFNLPVELGHKQSPLSKSIMVTDELSLTSNQNIFSFEFAALNYTHPVQNQYAYKMVGLEEEWNFVSNNNYAAYSNLSPGQYEFKVIASNNDGVWNKTGASLKIYVMPPWWREWWAYMIWTLLVVLVVYMIVRYRTAYLRAQRKVLQKKVRESTRELEQKNQHITMQAEELQTYNDALRDLNESLEQKVKERTSELTIKNQKLAEYAFINAHNLRVPVANIKGIIQLFNEDLNREQIFELLDLLKGQSEKMDNVLLDIKRMLEAEESSTRD